MKKIGWIGYGNMGIPMTNNLMNNDLQVMVYVRNKQKLNADVDKRFVFTESITELINHSDYIFLMLPNDDACESIINKLVEIPLNHKLVINMRTVSPDASVEMALLLKQHNARYIEAPVSGSVKPAQDGNLVILTAGIEYDIIEVSDCFDIMGKKTIYLGEIGTAAKAKIGINYYMSILIAGLADTLIFMENCSIEKKQMLDIINAGACASGLTQTKTPSILQNDFLPAFPMKYMTKDLNLAKKIGLKSTLGSIMLNSYQDADIEFGEEDLMAIIKKLK